MFKKSRSIALIFAMIVIPALLLAQAPQMAEIYRRAAAAYRDAAGKAPANQKVCYLALASYHDCLANKFTSGSNAQCVQPTTTCSSATPSASGASATSVAPSAGGVPSIPTGGTTAQDFWTQWFGALLGAIGDSGSPKEVINWSNPNSIANLLRDFTQVDASDTTHIKLSNALGDHDGFSKTFFLADLDGQSAIDIPVFRYNVGTGTLLISASRMAYIPDENKNNDGFDLKREAIVKAGTNFGESAYAMMDVKTTARMYHFYVQCQECAKVKNRAVWGPENVQAGKHPIADLYDAALTNFDTTIRGISLQVAAILDSQNPQTADSGTLQPAPPAPVAVAPPPKPADDGPSLEDTMKFIQDKLASKDITAYRDFVNNGSSRLTELRDISADATTCTLKYNVWTGFLYSSVAVSFKDVENIEVQSEQGAFEKLGGDPSRVDPALFQVSLLATRKVFKMSFPNADPSIGDKFTNELGEIVRGEDMANRVAKAIVHAVELCKARPEARPNAKPEPF